jgi:aminomethyltransferase
MMVVNASNIEKDWNWCQTHNAAGAFLENVSDQTAQLAVQGPKAILTLQKLTHVDLSTIPYYHFTYGTLAGVKNVLISNTGYTGAGGFEIYFPNEAGIAIWKAVFEAGAEFGIQPVGLGARDTLRLEMGFCLYGNDIDDTISPIEAGLSWVTKFTPDKHFPSRDLFERQKAEGVTKKRVGFEMRDKGFARHGYKLTDANGRVIGEVTSGSISPMSKIGIGMGYVETAFSKPGSDIFVNIRDRLLKAEVVKMPFRK